jgi:hypothetical protein
MSQKGINDTLAGSAAGIAQVLTSQPLDTIKTRAQIAPSASYSFSSKAATDRAYMCRGHVRECR